MEAHNHQISSAPSVPSPRIDEDAKRSRAHEERILDEALAATFPCSDPISSLSAEEVIPDEEEVPSSPPPATGRA